MIENCIPLLAKPIRESLFKTIASNVAHFTQTQKRAPKLVIVLVGNDPASVIYTSSKGKACKDVGMAHETLQFDQAVSPAEIRRIVSDLNDDETVDGILIQRPLPKQFKESEVVQWVSPDKDVDGMHPMSVGNLHLNTTTLKPCTPAGVMKILAHHEIPVEGKVACVLGRSSIVGNPMAALLLQANATVIHCHSKTKNLRSLTLQADLIVSAVGKPEFLTGDYVKPGAVVVDVGIHRNSDGKIVGDVHAPSVSRVASALTPVPGGVGPMTIAMLIQNTLEAATQRTSVHS